MSINGNNHILGSIQQLKQGVGNVKNHAIESGKEITRSEQHAGQVEQQHVNRLDSMREQVLQRFDELSSQLDSDSNTYSLEDLQENRDARLAHLDNLGQATTDNAEAREAHRNEQTESIHQTLSDRLSDASGRVDQSIEQINLQYEQLVSAAAEDETVIDQLTSVRDQMLSRLELASDKLDSLQTQADDKFLYNEEGSAAPDGDNDSNDSSEPVDIIV